MVAPLNTAVCRYGRARFRLTLSVAVIAASISAELRQNSDLLGKLRDALKERLDVQKDIEEVNILRINNRKALYILLMAVFLYCYRSTVQ